jgi:hypothetical protein
MIPDASGNTSLIKGAFFQKGTVYRFIKGIYILSDTRSGGKKPAEWFFST